MFDLKLDKAVEGVARRLPTYPPPDRIPLETQGKSQGEHFGNTLDRKGLISIANPVLLAINGLNSDTELIGIHLSQGGDVGGDVTFPKAGATFSWTCRRRRSRSISLLSRSITIVAFSFTLFLLPLYEVFTQMGSLNATCWPRDGTDDPIHRRDFDRIALHVTS